MFSKDEDAEFIVASGDVEFDSPDEMRYIFNDKLSYLFGQSGEHGRPSALDRKTTSRGPGLCRVSQGVPHCTFMLNSYSAFNRVDIDCNCTDSQEGLDMVAHKGQVVGYARVSAADQNLARQLEALKSVDRLFTEKVSGKSAEDRTQLQELLAYVREGDKVLVKSPDRLARSTRDLLDLAEQLKDRGVSLEFIDNPALNTHTPQGEMMFTILSAIAQMERQTILERQAEGIALAKERGAYNRGPKLSPEQVEDARQRVELKVPKAVIARELGVSRSTLHAALNGTGRYSDMERATELAQTTTSEKAP